MKKKKRKTRETCVEKRLAREVSPEIKRQRRERETRVIRDDSEKEKKRTGLF